jgi:NAD(P)-dependent dehydrogenase (short-subunit alcohol dehydrogenase family)
MLRTAMITGAGGGLTQATARLLAETGWSLALVGRDKDALESVQEDLLAEAPSPNESIKIVLVQADVSDGEGATEAMDTARALLDQPVRALVHCDGGGMAFTDRARGDLLASSLDAAFFALGAFTEQLLDDGEPGAAVLVNSLDPAIRPLATASATGLADLVASAAATYAPHGLRVNGVAPGLLPDPTTLRFFGDTSAALALAEQYPLGRWGDVLDTARTIRWLLGEESSWITGQVVTLGGPVDTAARLPQVSARP